jgi:hypothetical protein
MAKRRRHRFKIGAMLAALLLALLAAAPAWSDGQGDSLAPAIKATFLYKFAPFVEWPDSAFASPTSPYQICVIGQDPLGDLLDRAVQGQHAGVRAFVVARQPATADQRACHIAFVSDTADQPASKILAALQGMPVLTVTDNAQDASTAGIINFLLVSNHVRFEIDAQAAKQNGLVISSKLLSLAVRVK